MEEATRDDMDWILEGVPCEEADSLSLDVLETVREGTEAVVSDPV